jgi:hypothetical protein
MVVLSVKFVGYATAICFAVSVATSCHAVMSMKQRSCCDSVSVVPTRMIIQVDVKVPFSSQSLRLPSPPLSRQVPAR